MNFWAMQILNSVSLGMLLFLIASGLSLIFGLMRIANLAHGSFYILGAYVGRTYLEVKGRPPYVVMELVEGAAEADGSRP